MYHLIKLEIRKNNLKPYMKACIFSFFVILGFTYFIAAVAKVEQEQVFQNYDNIFFFTSFISVIYFCILTTVMFSKIIIEAYKGKKLVLLLSYPVSRTKVFLSKITLVLCINVVSMIISYLASLGVFMMTESISPIVTDDLSIRVISVAILRMIPLALTVAGISIIALAIGFRSKSIQTTIVSAFVLVAIFGNMASGLSNLLISYMFQMVIVIVSLYVLRYLIIQVNNMDVE